MADAVVVERRRNCARFFCHRCNVEFEDILQDYVCPYCASGFIEQLESESESMVEANDEASDGDVSNLDDSDDVVQHNNHNVLNDLAYLMSGGQVRRGRPETFLEQLVWTIGAGPGSAGAITGGAVTAGAPFVLVGTPGDYVFGGEGLDAVVTQLLGQLENSGPPPLSRDQIAAIPSENVSPEQAAANIACSVCWENFQQGEKVSRLGCDHIFHSQCIEPWLRQHATCPICRRSLITENTTGPAPASGTALGNELYTAMGTPTVVSPTVLPAARDSSTSQLSSFPRVLLRRLPRRVVSGERTQIWNSPLTSSNSTASVTSSTVSTSGVWAPNTASSTNSTNSTTSMSTSSLNSNNDPERQYNMDMDFD